jgi:hypothetical protein
MKGARIDPTKVYIRIIEKPYNKAFFTPCLLDLALPVKKDTVIGIIGKTQGVKSAANPPRKAMTIKASKE